MEKKRKNNEKKACDCGGTDKDGNVVEHCRSTHSVCLRNKKRFKVDPKIKRDEKFVVSNL